MQPGRYSQLAIKKLLSSPLCRRKYHTWGNGIARCAGQIKLSSECSTWNILEECNPALSPISGCGDSGTAEFELFHVEQFVREHQKAGPYTIRTMPESKRLNELRVRRKNVPRGTLWPRSRPIPPLKCGTLANVPCGAFVSSSIRCCRTIAKP